MVGHMKTNRACPLFSEEIYEATIAVAAKEVEMEEEDQPGEELPDRMDEEEEWSEEKWSFSSDSEEEERRKRKKKRKKSKKVKKKKQKDKKEETEKKKRTRDSGELGD